MTLIGLNFSSLGGKNNDISGANYSVLLGGEDNLIQTGHAHFLGGGVQNKISGSASIISNALVGGTENKILDATYSFIGAGATNTIHSNNSVIGGGTSNIVSGDSSVVFGGSDNKVWADYGLAAGRYSTVQANHDGAFVLSDSNTTETLSSGANTLTLNFKSGVYVDSDSGIYVNGNPVLTGVSGSEGDTLQIVTDRGNTTTNNIKVNTISGSIGMIDVGLAIGPAGSPHSGPRYGLDCEESAFLGGTAIISGNIAGRNTLEVSGDAGGTGFGGRLTLGGTGYLLSGDVSETLQTVTDRGATTTNDVTVENLLVKNNGQVRANGNGRLTLGNTNGGTIRVSGDGSTSVISPSSNDLRIESTRDEDDIIFQAGEAGVEMARFDSENQRFGIGTNNPQKNLDIQGQFMVRPTSSTTVGRVLIGSTASDAYLELKDASSANKVFLNTDGVSYLNGGNIGIGDATPIGDLQIGTNVFSGANGVHADDRIGLSVNGSLKSIVYASTYNNATYPDYGMVFIHGPNTGDYNVWSISPDGPAKGSGLNFIYRKDTTNIHTTDPKVYFNGDGSVGIGTTNPTEPLEVVGDIFINGGPAGGRSLALKRTGATNPWKLAQGHTQTDYLEILEGSTTRFLIKNGGKVGIGTTNPAALLSIGGGNSTPSLGGGTILTVDMTQGAGNYASMAILAGNAGRSSLFFGDSDAEQRGAFDYRHADDSLSIQQLQKKLG